jgi:lipopolysaccharide export LptBFGC system permease protein LptF
MKIKTKTFVNSTQKTQKDIKFIWSSSRYRAENLYRLLFLICILIAFIMLVLCLVFLFLQNGETNSGDVATILGCIAFVFFLISGTFKLTERKIRKIRFYDVKSSSKTKIT